MTHKPRQPNWLTNTTLRHLSLATVLFTGCSASDSESSDRTRASTVSIAHKDESKGQLNTNSERLAATPNVSGSNAVAAVRDLPTDNLLAENTTTTDLADSTLVTQKAPSPRTTPPAAETDKTVGTTRRIRLEHDFGQVLEGTQLRHRFEFLNEAGTPLVLQADQEVFRSCGCTDATIPDRRVAPGKTAAVELTINTESRTGTLNEQVVTTWSRRGNQPVEVVCSATAKIQSAIATSPAELVFDRASILKGRYQQLRVRSGIDIDWSKAQLTVSSDYLQISKRSYDRARNMLTVRLKCGPVTPGESRRAGLRISAPDKTDKMHTHVVPVFAANTSPLRTTPPVLMFRSPKANAARPPAPSPVVASTKADSAATLPVGAKGQQASVSVRSASLIVTGEAIKQGNSIATIQPEIDGLNWTTMELDGKAIKISFTLTDSATQPPSELMLRMTGGAVVSIPVSVD